MTQNGLNFDANGALLVSGSNIFPNTSVGRVKAALQNAPFLRGGVQRPANVPSVQFPALNSFPNSPALFTAYGVGFNCLSTGYGVNPTYSNAVVHFYPGTAGNVTANGTSLIADLANYIFDLAGTWRDTNNYFADNSGSRFALINPNNPTLGVNSLDINNSTNWGVLSFILDDDTLLIYANITSGYIQPFQMLVDGLPAFPNPLPGAFCSAINQTGPIQLKFPTRKQRKIQILLGVTTGIAYIAHSVYGKIEPYDPRNDATFTWAFLSDSLGQQGNTSDGFFNVAAKAFYLLGGLANGTQSAQGGTGYWNNGPGGVLGNFFDPARLNQIFSGVKKDIIWTLGGTNDGYSGTGQTSNGIVFSNDTIAQTYGKLGFLSTFQAIRARDPSIIIAVTAPATSSGINASNDSGAKTILKAADMLVALRQADPTGPWIWLDGTNNPGGWQNSSGRSGNDDGPWLTGKGSVGFERVTGYPGQASPVDGNNDIYNVYGGPGGNAHPQGNYSMLGVSVGAAPQTLTAAVLASTPGPVTVGASPFSYTATAAGTVTINTNQGGVVSAVTKNAVGQSPTNGVYTISVVATDVIVVTYTVAPSMRFDASISISVYSTNNGLQSSSTPLTGTGRYGFSQTPYTQGVEISWTGVIRTASNEVLTGVTKADGTAISALGAQSTSTFTASMSANTMTVTTTPTTSIVLGMQITGTGVPAGTVVLGFLSGTGGQGTYTMNNPGTVASTACTGTLFPYFVVTSDTGVDYYAYRFAKAAYQAIMAL